jgi:sterol desaturase/sphingolipid hydroxylase (fatty acid hydroxylase superfamily)
VALLAEPPILGRMRRRGADVLGYPSRQDTAASLAMGLGSIPFVTAINAVVYTLAKLAWPHRLTDLGDGVVGWTAAIVGWDFAYYWHHRFEHEIRLFWACHVNHHSSRYFNFSTALRQPWTPFLGIVLYPPLAFLGVRPWMILVSGGFNLIYQFWVHTEAVGKLPRPIELVFNTPSHHRVHHGTNTQYLDKNYGGILIVWDRIFRSFEEEEERVVYGLTKDIDTFNPLRIAFHEYAAMGRDVIHSSSAREAMKRVFGGPGP